MIIVIGIILLPIIILLIVSIEAVRNKEKTEEEGIFIDQNGNKYQLIKNKDDDVAEEDEDNTIQLDIKKEEKID